MFDFIKAAVATVLLAAPAYAQDLPVIRAATLEIGTVNWEMQTIIDHKLDEKHGFKLVMQSYADNGATRVAVEGDEADMAVADWIWVARQNAEGKAYTLVPYSKAVGGLVAKADAGVNTLQDLKGAKVGIAGGPLDKSWLILRAYATQEYGMDLAAKTEQVFGAPPLIFKAGLDGETKGSINFWHFLAKMKAAGMVEVINVETAATALGLNPDTPLLGYYMKQDFVAAHEGIAQALYDASRDAKDLLAADPTAWDAIRPQMNAEKDSQFEALKADWLAGTPNRGPVNVDDANKLLALMNDLGGAELVGQATSVPEGLFADVK